MTTDSAAFYAKAPPDRGASSFVYPPTPDNLAFFAQALGAGCLVAMPTETVYGLAGLALDESACRSIFEIKGRPLVDPLIVHVANPEMMARLVLDPSLVQSLVEAFWPGPLTLVLRKTACVPDLVTAGKPTVAVRMPRHPVAHALLEKVGQPLAAPSANPFGYVSPSTARHVADSFGNSVPFILDGGPCEVGLESTILDMSSPDDPRILRPGAVTAAMIETILGQPVTTQRQMLTIKQPASAPGTFARHYSPATALHLFNKGTRPEIPASEAMLLLRRPKEDVFDNVYWLSEEGGLDSAARALFALLRQLDAKGYDRIHCELPGPQEGDLATAITDRLTRAAAK